MLRYHGPTPLTPGQERIFEELVQASNGMTFVDPENVRWWFIHHDLFTPLGRPAGRVAIAFSEPSDGRYGHAGVFFSADTLNPSEERDYWTFYMLNIVREVFAVDSDPLTERCNACGTVLRSSATGVEVYFSKRVKAGLCHDCLNAVDALNVKLKEEALAQSNL